MTEESAVERFDRTAANYPASPHHAGGRSLIRLIEVAGPSPGERVLDLACGSGHAALALAPAVSLVVGFDPAPRMLAETARAARGRGLGNLRLCRGLAERLPFRAASFALVVSRIAPHHFAAIEEAVGEMARVLAPGGRAVVADLVGWDDPEADGFVHRLEKLHDPTHVRSHTLRRWRELFEQAGLEPFHEEQFREPDEGLLVSEWCRVAQTPPPAAREIRRLCLGAPARLVELLGIRSEDGDVRLAARRIGVIGGRRRR